MKKRLLLILVSVIAACSILIAIKFLTGPPLGMAEIPAGCYMMGSESKNTFRDAKPVHEVCLDTFYMDITEVTQEQFVAAMGRNPSRYVKGHNFPVDSVNHTEASKYCVLMGKRLPTEAEWEKAARGGTQKMYYWGNRFIGEYGWVKGNSNGTTHAVGQKKPNQYGLYDMAGNMSEWVMDSYDIDYYKKSPRENPQGPKNNKYKVRRGGSWHLESEYARPFIRGYDSTYSFPGSDMGFRCVK